MGRVIFGLFKGLIVGLGASVLVWQLPWIGEWAFWGYLLCGLVGALVGVVCGTPPWKTETFWTPLLKSVFGFAFGLGFCALGRYFLPQLSMQAVHIDAIHFAAPLFSPALLAPALGLIYGIIIELDDSGH